MEQTKNLVDFSFLDSPELKSQLITVLIILNRPINKEMFLELRPSIDFIICADGAANRMHDNLDKEE
jgi:hypothetical protein